jgi:hypothetical protein
MIQSFPQEKDSMIRELTEKKFKTHSKLATCVLMALFLLAVASASGQQVHQLLYNGSTWMDENLNGTLVDPVFTGVAAFPTTPNEQLHVYYLESYLDADHVHQLFYNGVSWSDEDLTTLSGGEPAQNTSAVVGFPVGNYQYVFFVGFDSHIHQLLYNNVNWTDTDLTVLSGGTLAYTANLVAFTTSPALHVYYTDFGQHIHQLFATSGTNWQDQDLTKLTGAGLAAYGASDMTGFEIDNFQYVYYLDVNVHVHQLYYNNSTWSDEDLTALTKTSPAGFGGISALAIPGTKKMRVYLVAGINDHVLQLSSTNNAKWTSSDLTKRAKGQLPGGAVAISAVASAGRVSVFYASNSLYRIFQPTSTKWANENLTLAGDGDEVTPQTQIVGFSLQNNLYIYYVGN